MKKTFALVMVLSLIFTFIGCGKAEDSPAGDTTAANEPAGQTAAPKESPAASSDSSGGKDGWSLSSFQGI